MTRLVRWLPGLTAAAVMTLTFAVPATGAVAAPTGHAGRAAAATDPEFFTRLHGSSHFPNTRGHSEYSRGGGQREVDVTVNNAPSRIRRHNVVVYVNRKRVGTMWVNRFGHAEREWDTDRGQFVPWATSGSPVRVRTVSGTLVVSGRYHLEAD